MSNPKSTHDALANNYIRGAKPTIEINRPWTQKELQAYINQSGLLTVDKEGSNEDKRTTTKLNELFQSALKSSLADTPQGKNSRVRLGGIKSEMDFLTFINSPAGKGAKTAIALQIKKRVEERNQQQFEQREKARKHALIRKFLLSLFLLEYLESKAHAAEINEQVNKQNAKRDSEYYEEKREAAIADATDETEKLLSHHNALTQETDDLQNKLHQTEDAIKQVDEKLDALNTLQTQMSEALAEHKTLHDKTDALLKKSPPKTDSERQMALEGLKAHTESIQSKMDDLSDQLAAFTPKPGGIHADELLNASRELLDTRQQAQFKLAAQLQDLKEDHAVLTHHTHLHTHADKLAELKELFLLEDGDNDPIPVYPELPPEILRQRAEELCELGGGVLFDKGEKEHIKGNNISPLELFQEWMNSPYRFYDESGVAISPRDKHEKGAYMLPRTKNLIVHDGVKYIVPSYIKTADDLKKLSGSELLAAKHEGSENRYRPASRYCENCIQRANREKEELLMTQKGYKETLVLMEAELTECGNQAREMSGRIAHLHQQSQAIIEGKTPVLNLSPSRGSSKSSNFPSRLEHAQAAYLAMTVQQTEQIVEEYIAAVGEENLIKTDEYDILQRIMASGNPEEKRNLLLRLETMNGGITASMKETMSSPYANIKPAGSPKKEMAADIRLDGPEKAPSSAKSPFQTTPKLRRD